MPVRYAKSSISQAFANSMGIKLQPHDVARGYSFRALRIERARSQVQVEARNLARDLRQNAITRGQYERGMERIRKKMERIEQEARALQGAD